MLRTFLCSFLAIVTAVIAGICFQASSFSDFAPHVSPVSGASLPPMVVFKIATKLSAMVDALAFALKPPGAQIMALVSGYQTTQALGAFASMRIGEAIEKLSPDGMADVKDIAMAVGADADALCRLLRMLSALGVVSSDGKADTTKFSNTPASKMLIKDAKGSLWGAALAGASNHYLGWTNLEAPLTKGASTISFDSKFGMSYWEHIRQHPEEEAAFAHFMTGISWETNAAVAVSGANFSACGAIVDMGGGHGSLLAEVIAAFPALSGKATVLDLPSVVTSAPVRTGITFQGGDLFETMTVPRGKDTNCYSAKSVLHDWNEDKALAILKSVTVAMEAAGVPKQDRKLFLTELVLTSGDALLLPKVSLDVNMMALAGGQERTEAEWASLLDKAGWIKIKSYPTRSLYTVMEAVPKAT